MKIQQRKPIIIPDPWDDLQTRLCKIRGIDNIKEFLKPTKKFVHPYKLLGDCLAASKRIVQAIKNNEKICIHFDIDTDGVTAGDLAFLYLNNYTNNIFLVFHERQGGHGVKVEEVPKDCDLLIVVDSSTNSHKECEELSKKMDILILDHHPKEKGIENPHATIVNPQLCDYPNKHLSGVGVVYKVCQCLDDLLEKKIADNYLDIVATGLIGDMMNMQDMENRYLVYKGLSLMKSKTNGNEGIKQALKALNQTDISSSSVGFYLVPLLNSSIRLNNIETAIELLALDGDDDCRATAKIMKERNDERKREQKEILEIISPNIDENKNYIFLDVNSLGINPNLKGLIANDISEKYKKPSFLMGYNENYGNYFGSARSGGLKRFKSVLRDLGSCKILGGHEEAFGISIKSKDMDGFDNKLTEFLNNLPEKVLEYDLELELDEITMDLCKTIKQLNYITGQGFKEIVVKIDNIQYDDIRTMGSENNHIKIKVDDIELVKFKVDEDTIEELKNKNSISVLATLDINSFFNRRLKRDIKTKQIRILQFIG